MTEKLKVQGRRILEWYEKNKRDLPWRHTNNPYRIWISEIMLQETRVDTVIEYYHRFISRFPDVEALARAGEEEVLALWKGLGYYSRARNLHKAAQLILEQYGGRFPVDYEEVRKLPGIGTYTAGAVISIAFNQSVASVDGNVLRVISRLEGLTADIGREKTKAEIAQLALKMMPEGRAGDFNQSLMEHGALICIPKSPKCDQCPVQDLCTAALTQRQAEIPVSKKRGQSLPEIHYWAAVIEDGERILLEYRKNESLLGRLWGVPMVEKKDDVPVETLFNEKYGLELFQIRKAGGATHVFTHRIWQMDILRCSASLKKLPSAELDWIEREKIKELAVPTAFQKVLQNGDSPQQTNKHSKKA